MSAPEDLQLVDAALPARAATLLSAPAELLLPERLLLYSLVRALAPGRCLEIGTHFGGSTVVLAAALDDAGGGVLLCVDREPRVAVDVWRSLSHRARLVRGDSPAVLPQACEIAGGLFDFAFVDGDHSREGVLRDIEGLLQVAAPGAHLVFHDAHYWQVRAAIDEAVAAPGGRLIDVGMISTAATPESLDRDGHVQRWGGLRMLRVCPVA